MIISGVFITLLVSVHLVTCFPMANENEMIALNDLQDSGIFENVGTNQDEKPVNNNNSNTSKGRSISFTINDKNEGRARGNGDEMLSLDELEALEAFADNQYDEQDNKLNQDEDELTRRKQKYRNILCTFRPSSRFCNR